MPHVPQLAALVWVSAHVVPQSVCPVAQPHLPAVQLPPPLQAMPHIPQFRGSVWNELESLQPVPHTTCAPGQVATHFEAEQ